LNIYSRSIKLIKEPSKALIFLGVMTVDVTDSVAPAGKHRTVGHMMDLSAHPMQATKQEVKLKALFQADE
jgi:hypothetical protein